MNRYSPWEIVAPAGLSVWSLVSPGRLLWLLTILVMLGAAFSIAMTQTYPDHTAGSDNSMGIRND